MTNYGNVKSSELGKISWPLYGTLGKHNEADTGQTTGTDMDVGIDLHLISLPDQANKYKEGKYDPKRSKGKIVRRAPAFGDI